MYLIFSLTLYHLPLFSHGHPRSMGGPPCSLVLLAVWSAPPRACVLPASTDAGALPSRSAHGQGHAGKIGRASCRERVSSPV